MRKLFSLLVPTALAVTIVLGGVDPADAAGPAPTTLAMAQQSPICCW